MYILLYIINRKSERGRAEEDSGMMGLSLFPRTSTYRKVRSLERYVF